MSELPTTGNPISIDVESVFDKLPLPAQTIENLNEIESYLEIENNYRATVRYLFCNTFCMFLSHTFPNCNVYNEQSVDE